MNQQKSSKIFQSARRVFAYLITPLMVSAVGWLSNEVGDAFKDSSKPLAFSFFTLLALLAFVLFCIVVISNVNERDPGNPQNIQIKNALIMRIVLFFILTLAMGVCIALVGNYLEDIIKQFMGSRWLWTALAVASLACLLADTFIVSNVKWQFSSNKTHLVIASAMLLYALVVVTILIFKPHWNTALQKLSIAVPTSYLVYLFFRIARTFAKPYNKLHQEDNLPAMKHLVIFLSDPPLRANEKLTEEQVFNNFFTAPQDPSGRKKITTNMIQAISPHIKTAQGLACFFKARCAQIDADNPATNDSLTKICSEVSALDKFVKWEMPLRAIAHHADHYSGSTKSKAELSDLTIFISSSAQDNTALKSKTPPTNTTQSKPYASVGSAETLPYFIDCLKAYFKHTLPTIRIACCETKDSRSGSELTFQLKKLDTTTNLEVFKDKGINFGSYQAITDALDTILHDPEIIEIGHANTIIDVTGGPKPTSVAGALAATVLDIMNQYVDTNDKTVKGYDFQYVDPTKSA